MSDLIKALKARVEFDERGFLEFLVLKSSNGEKPSMYDTARFENKRLQPLLEKVIAVVEAAEFAMQYYASCGEEADPEYQLYRSHQKVFAELRLAVGEKWTSKDTRELLLEFDKHQGSGEGDANE